MYVESHTLGMTNHNSNSQKFGACVCGQRSIVQENEAGHDDDNCDAYSAVELVQLFTRTAIKSVTSKICSSLETAQVAHSLSCITQRTPEGFRYGTTHLLTC